MALLPHSFSRAVELNMLCHTIAAHFRAGPDPRELRLYAVDEVKRTNGQVSFESAVRSQRRIEPDDVARIVLISPLWRRQNAAKLAQRASPCCHRPAKLLANERSTLPCYKKAARCGCTCEPVWNVFCAAIVKETFAKTHRCKPAKSQAPIKKSYRQKRE